MIRDTSQAFQNRPFSLIVDYRINGHDPPEGRDLRLGRGGRWKTAKECSVAFNLANIVDGFKGRDSIEQAFATVEIKENKYQNRLEIQKGLGSLEGVVMVATDCPVFNHLWPMVRFHLPFASGHETVCRLVSMYLVEQYFRMKDGGNPDWELEAFAKT